MSVFDDVADFVAIPRVTELRLAPDGSRLIATVSALSCDILLTPHPGASDFWERIARRKSPDDAAPLVDTGAFRAYASDAGKALDAQLARERTTTK